jgi:hypothetical protein
MTKKDRKTRNQLLLIHKYTIQSNEIFDNDEENSSK